jgi:hypothetical protein
MKPRNVANAKPWEMTMAEHVLKRKTISYHGKAAVLIAYGGLHYIRGNKAPYFSLTGEVAIPGRRDCEECGCIHERLLEAWPELADLAALHLSDIDGSPSHGSANGWYAMAGALGGAGERYHAGNQESYGRIDTSPEGCLKRFAEHARIDLEEARALRDLLQPHVNEANAERASRQAAVEAEYGAPLKALREWSDLARYYSEPAAGDRTARAVFDVWFAKQAERFKAEADACIAKHGLVVYGDAWKPEAAA